MPEITGISEYSVGKPPVIESFGRKSIPVSEILGRKPKAQPEAKKPEYVPFEIKDESKRLEGWWLEPQQKTVIHQNVDYSDAFRNNFEYRSHTRSLEVGTQRTQILQDIVDKMTAGHDIRARVVIMNRGQEYEASTAAEGTIFISQSILNGLSSVDEVAGVLAHEVGHLVFRTFENTIGNGMVCSFGVGWAHEEASDLNAPALLEKAGFRSSGFIDAIKTISGTWRGDIHQSGLSRAAQNIMLHGAVDYETSGLPSQPIPDLLRTDYVEPTNLEVFKEAFRKNAITHLEAIASYLHPRDFTEAYEMAIGQDQNSYKYEIVEKKVKIIDALRSVARKRFQDKGYSKDEIDLFFLLDKTSYNSFSFLDSPQRLPELATMLTDLTTPTKLREMVNSVLGKSYSIDDKWGSNLLRKLRYDSYDVNHLENYYPVDIKYNIPLTEDTLIQTLSIINGFPYSTFSDYDKKPKMIAEVLGRYVDKVYRGKEYKKENKQDEEKVHAFLVKVKKAGIDIDLKGADIPCYKTTFQEIFPQTPDVKVETLTELMDFFVESYTKSEDPQKKELFEGFVKKFNNEVEEQKLDNRKVLSLLRHLSDNIDASDFDADYSLLSFLDNYDGLQKPKGPEDNLNDRILKYNLKTCIALGVFKSDSNEFYTFIEDAFEKSGIDPATLTRNQLINLSIPLLAPDKSLFAQRQKAQKLTAQFFGFNYLSSTDITNFSRLEKYPLIERLLKITDSANITTLEELNEYLKTFSKGLRYSYQEVFSENPMSVLMGIRARQALAEILKSGINRSEFSSLYSVVETIFPPGPDKTEILREINRQYILSPDIPLRQKIDHFKRNADQLGIEGVLLVADQITTMDDYLYFRSEVKGKIEDYLSGKSDKTSEIALADRASAEVVKDFKLLLDTTKEDLNSKRISNGKLAEIWSKTINAANKYSHGEIEYDPKTGKIAFESKARGRFKTLSDLIRVFKGLSPIQRFAISQKALLDQGGALTTPENRQLLGTTLVNALNPHTRFIAEALRLAATDAPADFISIPASQMLSGLLFRGFDVNFAAPAGVKIEGIPRIKTIPLIRSTTREATIFGPQYIKNPKSRFAQLARESDMQFQEISRKIREQLGINSTSRKESKGDVDSSTEAIIKGVEMTGALGVRSLQLARQLHRFPEAVDKRLSQAFDARPGLSKLLFWENLLKMSQNGNGVKAFTDRLVTLDGYLGGGSLYTTFAGTVKNTDGTTSQVAVKMLNPNQEMFIQQPYKIVGDILSKISADGNAEDSQYARMAQAFLDMSNEWCLKDIGDPTFEKDDDAFRTSIASYNSALGSDVFYAPERTFNSYKVKSEDLAKGQTLNKVLNDPSVPPSQKQALVQLVSSFFEFQTKMPLKDPEGNEYYLVHSDPHIGNFMVDLSSGQPKIGIIDRNMYLRMEKADVDLFRPLMEGKSYGSMLEPMVERLLDINKITGEADRRSIKNRILHGVRGEFVIQTWESLKRLRLKPDNFALLRKFMGEASGSGLTLPLEYQLMIRNIEAFRELQKRYAVKPS